MSEIHPWRFKLEIFPSQSLHVYLQPKYFHLFFFSFILAKRALVWSLTSGCHWIHIFETAAKKGKNRHFGWFSDKEYSPTLWRYWFSARENESTMLQVTTRPSVTFDSKFYILHCKLLLKKVRFKVFLKTQQSILKQNAWFQFCILISSPCWKKASLFDQNILWGASSLYIPLECCLTCRDSVPRTQTTTLPNSWSRATKNGVSPIWNTKQNKWQNDSHLSTHRTEHKIFFLAWANIFHVHIGGFLYLKRQGYD